MGIYDRDYTRPGYQSPTSGSVGTVRMWSVNTWIIVLCIAVFVLSNLITARVLIDGQMHRVSLPEMWGYFSVNTAVLHFQVWRFITFQFLHANFTHILFNMIALYFFGPLIETYLGSRRYLAFYLICGIAGPIMYMVLWRWES